jgi:hypothetical protein
VAVAPHERDAIHPPRAWKRLRYRAGTPYQCEMRLLRPFSLCALLGVSVCAARAAAADEPAYSRFKVSLGYHYSSGTYGTSDTTEIAYVPLIARAEIGRWTLQGTVPYLRISSPAGLVVEGPNGPIQTTTGESDGLGDMLALGSYTLPPATVWAPFVDFIGLVKFPTASRSKGLGTGKFDFGIETEVSWALQRLTPFATVGYRFLGSPPGTPLHDTVLASVGGMYRVLDAVNAGLLLDYRQAASASSGERLELVPFASWKVDLHWSVEGYASAGLARGSPDAGVGLQIGYALSPTSTTSP